MRLFQQVCVISLLMTSLAVAQETLDHPVGQKQAYNHDSGLMANKDASVTKVHEHTIAVEGAAWLRVYFGKVQLDRGSFIRVTSMLDGEVQELNSSTLRLWDNTTAYFNGDQLKVELVAGAQTTLNRLVIDEISQEQVGRHTLGGPGQCGICGADNRTPSSEEWTARLFPAGCTASVYDEDSCMVSAGHCVDGTVGDVVQFNVPNSLSNCQLLNPPIADQFPIALKDFQNGGVGNDWSVLIPGTNNLGQKPFERYGELRALASSLAPPNSAGSVVGYGVDQTCTLNQTQQSASGIINSVFTTFYEFTIDMTFGNSGSGLIHNNEIVGIVTHCPCPNIATRIDRPGFVAARAALCTGVELSDCCFDNGTPGCEDSTCEATVCACDPFCCDTVWDEFCAGDGFNGNGCGAAILCEELCTPDTGVPNDDCADAEAVGEGSFPFDTIGSTTDGPALPGACDEGFGLTLVNDVWFEYTASCTGDATAGLCTSDYDTRMAVYNDGNCPGSFIDCNDDACGTGGLRSELTFAVNSGTSYLVRVGGFSGPGTGTLDISCDEGGCMNDGECSDGLFCNGAEVCNAGTCEAGTPPDCNDTIACTIDFCNPGTDSCMNAPDDGLCDNGQFCDGAETCDAQTDCQAGVAPDCNDGVGCTDDSCNEGTDSCDNVPNNANCDNGQFCDGAETCDAQTDCQAGVAPDCNDGVGCTDDSCNQGTDSCDNVPNNANCDNGQFCDGAETCDAQTDCQAGVAPDCNDSVGCTDDSCNEGTDSCDNVPNNALCDNGQFCDGAETCDAQTDCQAGVAPDCNDGVGCTDDSCNEGTDSCDNVPNNANCDNGQFCDGAETCDAQSDCQAGSDPCPGLSCDEGADTCTDCLIDDDCDDGAFCNGAETCEAGSCQDGTVVDCDDGVDCTDDSCNEGTDSCESVTNDANCDNGMFCDGAETCDAVQDCIAGADPDCDDGVPCTDDSCNEGTDSCDNVTNDANCDNGLFCDGAETCDAVQDCTTGTAPDCDDDVDCTDDSCNEGTDSCDNVPNNGLCDNGSFCDGAEICDAVNDCGGGVAPDCNDNVGCTDDSCNVGTDSCENIPNNANCDDEMFCNGTETCDSINDCQDGADPCPPEECDEDTDMCVGAPCTGDINGDGMVDVVDLLELLANWGNNPSNPDADLNDDGMVDVVDLLALLATWGPCP